MTEAVIQSRSKFSRDVLAFWRGTVVTVSSVVAVAWSAVALCQFLYVVNVDQNPVNPTFWVFMGGLMLSAAYLVVSLALSGSIDHDSFSDFWSDVGKRLDMLPFVAWLPSFAAIPLATVIIANVMPYALLTKDHQVRMMDDGRFVSAGQSVPASRYASMSTPVPLGYGDRTYDLSVGTDAGTVTVRVLMDVNVADSEQLRQLLAANRAEVVADSEEFVGKQAADYLASKVGVMVREMQAGSAPDGIVRMTQLVANDDGRPPWLTTVTIKGVQIVKGIHTLG